MSAKSQARTRGTAPGRSARAAKIAYATVQFDEHGKEIGKDNVERVIDIAQGAARPGLEVELGGQPIEEARQEEGDASFAIGLLAAIVILLFTFGSVVAMGLPILTALFALGVGLSLVTLGTHVFDTANFATQLAAMIGLGVGIDYALFILTRFRNGLDEGLEPQPAAVKAINTAGRAVLFAGLTVIISLLGMLLLGVTFLYGVAIAAAIAVAMTMIASLTLLPALLAMAGHRVDRLRIPGLGKRRPPAELSSSRWYRWSATIQRHPVVAMLLSGGLLIVLCIPVLSLRLGSSDAGSDPAGTTTRKAYDLLAEGFGPGFNGPFTVVAELPEKGEDAVLRHPPPPFRKRPRGRRRHPAGPQPGQGHRRDPGLSEDLAAERGDDRAAAADPRRDDPAGRRAAPTPPSMSAASPRSSRTSATCWRKSCRCSSASSCCSRRCC